jgi:hypothetical protein
MTHKRRVLISLAAALALMPAAASWADPAGGGADYQKLEKKYQQLQKQMATMARQMSTMQKEQAALKAKQAKSATTNTAAIDREVKRLYRRVMKNSQKISDLEPGNIQVLIAGDVNFQFQNVQGSHSTFYADSSPMIQVRIDKNIFVNTAFDFYTQAGAAGGSAADIGAANINYELNNYMTLGGGLVTSPIGGIVGQYNPAPWNRWLVDGSLEDALLPGNELGVWTRGGLPAPDKMGYFTYFLFVSNGPSLVTTNDQNGNSYNNLQFGNWDPAAQNGKTIGGRFSYIPIPNIEVGYSFEWARPSADGAITTTNSLINAVDINTYYVNRKIDGLFRFRGGWTWDQVGQGIDSTGAFSLGGYSNGGQAEIAYQPSLCGIKYIDKMMAAFRYDRIDGPAASNFSNGAAHEQRYSIGLDYWLHSNAVLKFEYEFDNLSNNMHGNNAMFVQFAVGI